MAHSLLFAQAPCPGGIAVAMSSVLAQQLRKINLALGHASDARPDTVVSLLYSAQEAADIDTQTVYENAVSGEHLLRPPHRLSAPRPTAACKQEELSSRLMEAAVDTNQPF